MLGKKTTSWRRRFGIVALLLGAGCGLGEDPDPRDHAPKVFALVAKAPTWRPPVPVTARIETSTMAAPAPLLETVVATDLPPRQVTIAIGQNARQVLDPRFERNFAAAQTDRSHDFTLCTDRNAVELLLVGTADFAVIGDQLSQRELQAGLRQTRLGIELFALAMAPEMPVRSLSRSQLRQVFTGEVTEWRQLGFDGGQIVPVVPAEAKQAERAARTLIPGDDFAASAVRVASTRHVADQLLQHPGAIGIVRITGEAPAGMKLVQIDWCPPTAEAYDYGTYPFGVPLHLVTAGPVSGEALRFLEFVRSDATRDQLANRLLLP